MVKVFGITGTNGKTTASWMLRNILQQTAPCSLIGTIGYIIKDRTYQPVNTTPGKDMLEKLFTEMHREKIRQCVMEVSSHGIHQGRIDGIIFSSAGFTNLSRDHLDYHGTMEEYYQTKKRLFLHENIDRCVNLDDEYGLRLYEELKGDYPVSGYSLQDGKADYYGHVISTSLGGTVLEFYENEILLGHLEIPVAGRQFAEDAMLAAAMARQAGAGFEETASGISRGAHVAGRMEMTGSEEDTLGIIDYAHTPDSLERLLKTVSEHARGKLLCVFGCGGFRDKGKRQMMGRIAGTYSDYCIITNDNPRGEPPENIALAIEEGLYPTGCGYSIILDRYQAIKRAVCLAGKWDIIVVAGKGHEAYQLTGGECIPFDDKSILKELLEKKYERTYNETDQPGHRRPPDRRK